MAYAQTVNTTFLALPADGNLAGYGAENIRADKQAWVERLQAEHELDTGISANQARHGFHKAGSAIAYIGKSLPTTRPDGTELSADVSKTLDDGLLAIMLPGGTLPTGVYARKASTLAGGVDEPAVNAPGVAHKGWVCVSNLDELGAATKNSGVTVQGVKMGGDVLTEVGWIQVAATGVKLRGGKINDGGVDKSNALPGETNCGPLYPEPLDGQADAIVLKTSGDVRVRSVIYTCVRPSAPVDGQEWMV